MIREQCGMSSDKENITFTHFFRWWESGPALKFGARASKVKLLNARVREEQLPWIRSLFDAADVDNSGALDKVEFVNFYPELRDYLELNGDYVIPDADTLMTEIDTNTSAAGWALNAGNDMVEFEEFEAWFLGKMQQSISALLKLSCPVSDPSSFRMYRHLLCSCVVAHMLINLFFPPISHVHICTQYFSLLSGLAMQKAKMSAKAADVIRSSRESSKIDIKSLMAAFGGGGAKDDAKAKVKPKRGMHSIVEKFNYDEIVRGLLQSQKTFVMLDNFISGCLFAQERFR
jgi:hypothetical protein